VKTQRRLMFIGVLLLLGPLYVACGEVGEAPVARAEDVAGVSAAGERATADSPAYLLGVLTARGLDHLALSDAEWERFESALLDYRRDGAPDDLATLLPAVESMRRSRASAALLRERAAERDWLDEVASKDGAVVLPGGGVLQIAERGSGKLPTPTDAVRLDVRASLRDGTVFDSAVSRGKSTAHTFDEMLPCWSEALLETPVGSTLTLVCPAAATSGDRGLPPLVPPGAAVRFDIELLDARMDPASVHRNLR
jgi:FKBP-type peptidyl-prolyl cis-trans isomerase FkpA